MADPRRKDISDPHGTREPGKDITDPPVTDAPQGTQWTEPPPGAAPPNARSPHVDRGQTVARRRPVGMVLISALLLFNVVGAVMGLLGTLFGAGPVVGVGMGSVLYFLVMAVVLGIILYGFWTFQHWGWIATLTVTAIATALGLYQLFAFAEAGLLVGNLVGVIIGVLVIWYLTRPGVRAMFAHKSKI